MANHNKRKGMKYASVKGEADQRFSREGNMRHGLQEHAVSGCTLPSRKLGHGEEWKSRPFKADLAYKLWGKS